MPTKPTVLVVDDDPDSRDLLAEYLGIEGFEVTTASDGDEALHRFEQLHPQVVLMDLALPGAVDGWEATRRIKSHPIIKDVVVIAVTAHTFPKDQQRALHVGCDAVISKPLDVTALAWRIAAMQRPRAGS